MSDICYFCNLPKTAAILTKTKWLTEAIWTDTSLEIPESLSWDIRLLRIWLQMKPRDTGNYETTWQRLRSSGYKLYTITRWDSSGVLNYIKIAHMYPIGWNFHQC